jgi:hypothetical protein
MRDVNLINYQKEYYQKNKEWIRRNQTEYFKEYYDRNRLELKERCRIRNNFKNRTRQLGMEPIAETINIKKLIAKSEKVKVKKVKVKKIKPKPITTITKGLFTLSFD